MQKLGAIKLVAATFMASIAFVLCLFFSILLFSTLIAWDSSNDLPILVVIGLSFLIALMVAIYVFKWLWRTLPIAWPRGLSGRIEFFISLAVFCISTIVWFGIASHFSVGSDAFYWKGEMQPVPWGRATLIVAMQVIILPGIAISSLCALLKLAYQSNF